MNFKIIQDPTHSMIQYPQNQTQFSNYYPSLLEPFLFFSPVPGHRSMEPPTAKHDMASCGTFRLACYHSPSSSSSRDSPSMANLAAPLIYFSSLKNLTSLPSHTLSAPAICFQVRICAAP